MTIIPPVVAAVFPEVLGQPNNNLRNSQNHSDQSGQFKQVFDVALEDVRNGRVKPISNPCKGCQYYEEEQDICFALECNGNDCPELPCEKLFKK